MMVEKFPTFAHPVAPTAKSNLKAVSARLSEIAPSTSVWPRTRDLALTEAACQGRRIAEIATRLKLSEATVRTRWNALKNAACPDDLSFGLTEQETLLVALRNCVTDEETRA